MRSNRPGKFIVIDGVDGSGKATQTELLAQGLKRAGFQVEIADFPQYNTKSAGLVEEYLNGKYGTADQVGPYRASIFYACDRYDASFKIKNWLNQGKIVISNRYVAANLGHQGGKIANPLERKHFFQWLYQLEYEIFNIPKPDLNIILHVNAEISQKLALLRQKQDWHGKTNDIHQKNIDHLKKAERAYLEIAKNSADVILIECSPNGQMLGRQEIIDLIWRQIKIILKLSPLSPNSNRLYENKFLAIRSTDYYSLNPGEKTLIKNNLGNDLSIINTTQDILHIAPGEKIDQRLIQKTEPPERGG